VLLAACAPTAQPGNEREAAAAASDFRWTGHGPRASAEFGRRPV